MTKVASVLHGNQWSSPLRMWQWQLSNKPKVMEHRYGAVSTESNNGVQLTSCQVTSHGNKCCCSIQRGWVSNFVGDVSRQELHVYTNWQTERHFKTWCSLHHTCAPWLWVSIMKVTTSYKVNEMAIVSIHRILYSPVRHRNHSVMEHRYGTGCTKF